jgi:ribosomal protein L19
MTYFNIIQQKEKNYMHIRRHREHVKGLKKSVIFSVGDVIKVVFFRKNYSYLFEGVCISIKKKGFGLNMSFVLRNIILGIAIEMVFSYYANRLYNLRLQDYKRKFMHLRRNKLFFLAKKKNIKSIVH